VFPQPGHETTEDHEAPHEPLDVFDTPYLVYFSDGQDLVELFLDVVLGDDVPQELAPGDPKGAFFQFQPDAKAPEVSEGFFQVNNETTILPGLQDNAVDTDLQVVPDLPFKT
jgi:hypothetical protein